MENVKEDIIKTINELSNKLGVLCTVDESGKPHGAMVYYEFDENLNLYFATRTNTEKYKSVLKNHYVEFLITNQNPPKTIQIQGTVSEVSEPGEQEKYFAKILDTANKSYYMSPISQLMDSELVLMKITPSHAQLSNFDVLRETETFQEINF